MQRVWPYRVVALYSAADYTLALAARAKRRYPDAANIGMQQLDALKGLKATMLMLFSHGQACLGPVRSAQSS